MTKQKIVIIKGPGLNGGMENRVLENICYKYIYHCNKSILCLITIHIVVVVVVVVVFVVVLVLVLVLVVVIITPLMKVLKLNISFGDW